MNTESATPEPRCTCASAATNVAFSQIYAQVTAEMASTTRLTEPGEKDKTGHKECADVQCPPWDGPQRT